MENIIFDLTYIVGFFFFILCTGAVLLCIDALLFGFTGKSILFALEKWLFK